MKTETVVIPSEIETIPDKAKALHIQVAADAQTASTLLSSVKNGAAIVRDLFKPIKAAAKLAHDTACESEKRYLTPFVEAESWLKGQILSWQTRQEAERAERQRLAYAEAERVRAAEQKRLDAEADSMRLAAEEKRRAETVALAAQGRIAEAVKVAAAPVAVAPVQVAPTVRVPPPLPQPLQHAGVSFRETWKAEVTNKRIFLAWVLQGQDDDDRLKLVFADLTWLSKLARDSKREDAAPPGIRFICERVVAATGSR